MGPASVAPKRHIGLVPQDLAIYPELTAHENLALRPTPGMTGPGAAQAGRRGHRADRPDRACKDLSKKFSGGMKRRLNIGIGLLHQPTLLILDEPTVGVDPQSRNQILDRWSGSPSRAWPSSTRLTTWRRPSGSATGSASSTRAGSGRRIAG